MLINAIMPTSVDILTFMNRIHSMLNEKKFNNLGPSYYVSKMVLLGFSLTVKAVTLIFISGCGWAISSAKEGKSGFIYNLVKS